MTTDQERDDYEALMASARRRLPEIRPVNNLGRPRRRPGPCRGERVLERAKAKLQVAK
jgi:hypothetical protein